MKVKRCKKCGEIKPVSEFGKMRTDKSQLQSMCKECWRKWYYSAIGMYTQLKSRLKHHNYPKEEKGKNISKKKLKKYELMPQEEFFDWYNHTERKCCYCDISEQSLKILEKIMQKRKIFAGKRTLSVARLHLERKDNDKGYIKDNIAWACCICNVLKGAFWTSEEWREIARNYIRPLWQNETKNSN